MCDSFYFHCIIKLNRTPKVGLFFKRTILDLQNFYCKDYCQPVYIYILETMLSERFTPISFIYHNCGSIGEHFPFVKYKTIE